VIAPAALVKTVRDELALAQRAYGES